MEGSCGWFTSYLVCGGVDEDDTVVGGAAKELRWREKVREMERMKYSGTKPVWERSS